MSEPTAASDDGEQGLEKLNAGGMGVWEEKKLAFNTSSDICIYIFSFHP